MVEVSDQQWTEFVEGREEANFLQSAEWSKLHSTQGRVVVRQLIVDEDGRASGGWQGVVMDARRGRYLEVAGGPLIDWHDNDVVGAFRAQMKIVARQYKCVFVRIRPQLVDSSESRQILANAGFRRAPFHLYAENTNILDMIRDGDQLLASMRRQTRYGIRQAQKQSLEISYGSKKADLEQFYELQQRTAQRQGFVTQSRSLITGLAKAFGDKVRIYKVSKDGELLNMAVIVWFGQEADYFEAASAPEGRQFAGAYGLLWRAITDAQEAGLRRFNFWGITPDDKTNHRFAGVTTFKRGFGGEDVNYTPAHDLVINRLAYPGDWLVETIRRKKRKL